MGLHIRYAIVFAAFALLVSLVYVEFPGIPAEQEIGENSAATSSPTILLKDRIITVTIVDAPEERARGLSGRYGLAENEGMLFVFKKDDTYSFWMKDMLFAIDILWISREGVIVDVREKATPESYPTSFVPSVPARYVLELRAGWARDNGVLIGDVVEFDGLP